MTEEKTCEIKTKNVTIRLLKYITKSETECITINIFDNITNKVLKTFDIIDSRNLKKVWISNSETIKRI